MNCKNLELNDTAFQLYFKARIFLCGWNKKTVQSKRVPKYGSDLNMFRFVGSKFVQSRFVQAHHFKNMAFEICKV